MKTPAHFFFLPTLTLGVVGLSALAVLLTTPVVAQDTATEPLAVEPIMAQPVPSATPTLEGMAEAIAADPITEDSTSVLTAMPVRYGDQENLQLVPGQAANFSLRIRNNGDTPVTITSLAEDFIIGDDYITPVAVNVPDGQNRWAMAGWTTITPAIQVIQGNTTAAVQVRIQVPQDALPGGHYMMITHQPVVSAAPGNNNTSINQRVGTLIYGIVPGDFNEVAFLRNLTVPQLSDLGPVPFSFLVDNDSEAHIRPQLSVKIYNFWGKEIFSQAIESGNIFPKTSREFDSQWERIWGFGRYRLEITMLYGSSGITTTSTQTHFWLFPIWLFLAALVAVLALVAGALLVRRHYLHTKEEQAKRMKELETKISSLEHEHHHDGE